VPDRVMLTLSSLFFHTPVRLALERAGDLEARRTAMCVLIRSRLSYRTAVLGCNNLENPNDDAF